MADKASSKSHLHWPLVASPQPLRAGRFPLDDRDFKTVYLSTNHALHLYGYPCTMRFGDHEFKVEPGDMTISKAGVASSYHVPNSGHHLCIHFKVLSAPRGQACANIPVHLSLGSHSGLVSQRIQHIVRLMNQRTKIPALQRLQQAAASSALQELLLLVAWIDQQPQTQRRRHGIEAVQRLAAMIDDRFSKDLHVPDMTQQIGITQNYVAKLFREQFGMTISRYILTRRIEHAQLLLSSTNMPIGRIASRVGLADPHHFNKQFRKVTGLSPRAWKISLAK